MPATHYRRLYDEFAVRFNILGLEAQMPFVEAQKQASIQAGLEVPFGYKFLYWQPSDLERMKQACGAQLPIAIDCEHRTNWEPGRVLERIHEAKKLLRQEGLYWGIYTGRWWWHPQTLNSEDFKDDPWWHASYPFGLGVLPPVDFLPTRFDLDGIPGVGAYGGKTTCDVWQYANTCYLDELGDWDFDMNAMWVPTAPPPPAPEQPVGTFFAGDINGGLEKRPGQVVLWNEGKPMFSWGDPEGEGIGRIAKRFGDEWAWLRRYGTAISAEPGHFDAYWSAEEGD